MTPKVLLKEKRMFCGEKSAQSGNYCVEMIKASNLSEKNQVFTTTSTTPYSLNRTVIHYLFYYICYILLQSNLNTEGGFIMRRFKVNPNLHSGSLHKIIMSHWAERSSLLCYHNICWLDFKALLCSYCSIYYWRVMCTFKMYHRDHLKSRMYFFSQLSVFT